MKTALAIALWLAATCFTFASDPARFWAAAKPARRSAWVVTEQGAPVAPPAAPAAKSCPCSGQCACGCNAGKPCTCGNAATPAAAPPASYQPAPQVQQWYPRTVSRGGC